MRKTNTTKTTLTHSAFGNPDCPGTLSAVPVDLYAHISCNECGAVIRFVRAEDLQKTLTEMELAQNFCSLVCGHCGVVNVFEPVRPYVPKCGQANQIQYEHELRLVFDKMPGPDGARFIEAEDSAGRSVVAGEWRQRPDGYAELVIRELPPTLETD